MTVWETAPFFVLSGVLSRTAERRPWGLVTVSLICRMTLQTSHMVPCSAFTSHINQWNHGQWQLHNDHLIMTLHTCKNMWLWIPLFTSRPNISFQETLGLWPMQCRYNLSLMGYDLIFTWRDKKHRLSCLTVSMFTCNSEHLGDVCSFQRLARYRS